MKKYIFFALLAMATTHMTAQEFDFNEVTYTPAQTTFRLFAPKKAKVSVEIGSSFLSTEAAPNQKYKMRLGKDGIWTVTVNQDLKDHKYWFEVDGKKSVGVFAKAVGVNSSYGMVADLTETNPEGWELDKRPVVKSPADLVVYEMHHRDFSIDASSGLKHKGKFLALTEPKAIRHLKDLGVNAVHILPSYDFGSVNETRLQDNRYNWGYDPVNYNVPEGSYSTNPYDPTCRIREFKLMVQALHKAGIRVILDVVYNHTYDIENSNFQKTYPDYYYRKTPNKGNSSSPIGEAGEGSAYSNGSGCGNETASEQPMMRRFMIESVKYWINEYHIDGIRVYAVASMLYLDYGKKDGQWVANQYGGNENLDAIEFFKHLNSVIHGAYPGFLTIAEESTAWPKITAKPEDGGLGFSFKWNMGWMHDFCEYMKLDPIMRKGNHNGLTFAMSYNSAEKYILPLSHDEVVHLKCSMVNKMPGYKVDKYANLRVGYTFMTGHEGKKLLFMGQEFGQEHEWNEATELEWWRLEEGKDDNYLNIGLKYYVQKLLEIYRSHKCLYEIDDDWSGFEWINADDADRSIYSFFRKCPSQKKSLLFVLNMTPVKREGYRVGVPVRKQYKLLLNSTDLVFGGSGETSVPEVIRAKKGECDHRDQYIEFDLPAYGAIVFEFSL